MIGNALLRVLLRRGWEVAGATYHCHPSAAFRALDMQDALQVSELLAELKPSLVAVPAANPYVDGCQLHPEETRKVNVEGTLNVARACAKARAKMIFYSSDYVFDGLKGTYNEEDAVCPINEYGRQKAETEAGVLAASAGNLIIRTSGAYGWQWEPKNFVLQILRALGEGREMRVASDLRYNPTYVENLAEVVADLASSGASGIFHAVGAEKISRVDFARLAARVFVLDESLIKPVPIAEFGSPTPRPKETSLDTRKVRASVATALWGPRQGLEHMKTFEAEWRAYAGEHLPSKIIKP